MDFIINFLIGYLIAACLWHLGRHFVKGWKRGWASARREQELMQMKAYAEVDVQNTFMLLKQPVPTTDEYRILEEWPGGKWFDQSYGHVFEGKDQLDEALDNSREFYPDKKLRVLKRTVTDWSRIEPDDEE